MSDKTVTEEASAPRPTLRVVTPPHLLVERQLVAIEAGHVRIVSGQQLHEASVLLLRDANRRMKRTHLWMAASWASDGP